MASQINVNQNNNDINISVTENKITVVDRSLPSNIEVTQPVTNVVEIAAGPAGPVGPQGEQGDSIFVQKSGSLYFTTSSIEITGSLAVSGSTIFTGSAILNEYPILTSNDTGSLLLSSSFNAFTSSYNTGSFTGSFTGDGSQLTGIVSSKWSGSNPITREGNVEITGSLRVTGGITASLFGTASWAENAETASYSLFALTASYSDTASYVNPLYQQVVVSGSLNLEPSLDPDPSGLNLDSTVLFQSSSNTALGYDLYIRQNGNLVKWKWIEGTLETGLLYGGVVTYSGSNVFVSPGSGIIVEHNATTGSEVSPMVEYVTWNAITQSIVNIATQQVTYLYIDQNGALQQQSTRFTSQQYHDFIPLGAVGHFDYTQVSAFGGSVQTAYDQVSQIMNFVDAFGPLKISGYGLTGQAGSLRLSVGSGTSFIHGGFYENDPEFPSQIATPSQATASLARVYRSGSSVIFDTNGGALYTTVNPTQYDRDGDGTLENVGNSNWSIQRVFTDPKTGILYVYYGQERYTTLLNALQYLPTDPFTEGDTFDFTTFVGYLVLRGNATDITNTTINSILNGGLFRGSGQGSGGGIALSNLDDLTDVSIVSPTNGQALIYDNAIWKNGTPLNATSASFAGSGVGSFSGSFSGSFVGNGSQLTGINLSPTGSNTQVQFNDSGSFGADATFAWNNTDKRLILGTEAVANTNSRLVVIGKGTSTNTTFAVHNSTGTNNALVIRDDGFIGIGALPSAAYPVNIRLGTNANIGFISPAAGVSLIDGLNNAISALTELRIRGNPLVLFSNANERLALLSDQTRFQGVPVNINRNLALNDDISLLNLTSTTNSVATTSLTFNFNTTAPVSQIKTRAEATGTPSNMQLWVRNTANTAVVEVMRLLGNGNVLIGTTTDVASSILTINSTTKGFLPPRMTTTERNAIATPATGLTLYNTTTNTLDIRSSASVWNKFGSETLIIGTGTTSSTFGLQVHNSTGTNNALVVRDDGAVGIGTNAPANKFQVVGTNASSLSGLEVDAAGVVYAGRLNTTTANYINLHVGGENGTFGRGGLRVGSSGGLAIYGNTSNSFPNIVIPNANFQLGFSTAYNATFTSNNLRFTLSAAANSHTTTIQCNDNNSASLRLRSVNGSLLFGNANDNMVLTNVGNLLLGTTLEGASATKTLVINNGTSPTGNVTDSFQQYSADIVAGNAAPHFRTENGSIIKLYREAAVTTVQGLADALTNQGLLASSTISTIDELQIALTAQVFS